MKTIAVIPARGGSKRIPRKNIKQFCGKPMIAWSIEAANRSGCFDRIIVSTDDSEIADVARQYGAEVPFLRPEHLSDDHTGTTEVIKHTIEWLQGVGVEAELVCCIYATAPFVTSKKLLEGKSIIENGECDYAFTMTSYAFPIQRALRYRMDGYVEMINPELFKSRSQDLDEAWHDAGQFYWGTAQAWIEQRPIFSSRAIPIMLPRHLVQDIDTLEDWTRAEWLFKAMNSDKSL